MGGMLEVLKRFLGFAGTKDVLLAGTVCYLVYAAVLPRYREWRKKSRIRCRVRLQMEGQITEVNAFFDTGNSLYDPIAQKPVSIIQKGTLEKLCDADTMEKLQEFQRGKAEKEPALSFRRMHPHFLAYSSLGCSCGLLVAVTLDAMYLENENVQKVIHAPVVAFSGEDSSAFGDCQMILHSDRQLGGNSMMQAVLPSHFRMRMLPGFSRMLWRKPGEVYYIGGADVLPNPLSPQQESAVIESLTKEDSQQARASLIEHNLRLVVYIAQKFDNTGVGMEDLISIGTIGLIKAINTFNPEKKIKLATYASRCIENEILMYLRRNSRTRMEVSIDEPLNVDWDGNELLLSDILGTDEDVIYRDLEHEVECKLLVKAINKLNAREKMIICLRFGLNQPDGKEKTQKEVADLLGISQSYISRLEKRIMVRLKKEIVRYE